MGAAVSAPHFAGEVCGLPGASVDFEDLATNTHSKVMAGTKLNIVDDSQGQGIVAHVLIPGSHRKLGLFKHEDVQCSSEWKVEFKPGSQSLVATMRFMRFYHDEFALMCSSVLEDDEDPELEVRRR